MTLYIDLTRLGVAADARSNISEIVFPSSDQALISVSPDLRSAGSVLVLLNRDTQWGVHDGQVPLITRGCRTDIYDSEDRVLHDHLP